MKPSLVKDEVISEFNLRAFFPYKIRVFYRMVSHSVEKLYGPKFGLSAPEWRTMAVLGPNNTMSASEIVERSSMTKVIVSRAIKSLQTSGLMRRDINGDDKRKVVLRLTQQGNAIFTELAPKLLELEMKLLDGIPYKDVLKMLEIMDKIQDNIQKNKN